LIDRDALWWVTSLVTSPHAQTLAQVLVLLWYLQSSSSSSILGATPKLLRWTRTPQFRAGAPSKKKKSTHRHSVLGHHTVTFALAAPHKWARVVNKNQDRQTLECFVPARTDTRLLAAQTKTDLYEDSTMYFPTHSHAKAYRLAKGLS